MVKLVLHKDLLLEEDLITIPTKKQNINEKDNKVTNSNIPDLRYLYSP